MVVQSIAVTDYSTGTQYKYGDTSGAWTSIQAVGGKVNGNAGGSSNADTNAPTITTTNGVNVIPLTAARTSESAWATPTVYPWVPQATTLTAGGAAVTTDLRGLPSGWYVNGDGKVVPPSAAPIGKSSDVLVRCLC